MRKIVRFFKEFASGFREFGENITLIVNTILLFIVYLVGSGVSGVTAKLCKKHFFENKISSDVKSYWSDLNLKKREIDEYYRQF
ncbi:MAG: hypothetical protein KAJ54_03490 [Candidatus Aenigmarchaeota archaeon]|nr:hypothetical protein [Candidatus Aenigmarchaeota archaeon]